MRAKAVAAGIVFLFLLGAAHSAQAQVPTPTSTTPTVYGGERVTPGSFVIGGTTGFPKTSFDLYYGLAEAFDIGGHAAFTYGRRIDGDRQGVGFDLHVPFRWTLLNAGIVAGGLRASPYFMIGDGSPSVSVGADVGFMLDIALPKLFKIIVGPDIRTGFATIGRGAGRITGYDGGTWANVGIETLLFNKFHAGIIFHGGGNWGSGGLGGGGVFRANLFFAAIL